MRQNLRKTLKFKMETNQMKDAAKDVKGIRQVMLSTLNTHGELTVDGMMEQIHGYDRKAIASNVAQLVIELLVTRRKDDFTGSPAYRITDLGKSRIKSNTAPKPSSPSVAPIKAPLRTSAAPVDAMMPTQKDKALIIDLRSALKESESVREMHAKSIVGLELEKADLIRANSVLRESLEQKAVHLQELIDTNSSLAKKVLRTVEQKPRIIADQFLLRAPKRKPLIVKSLEKARQHAMSAAATIGTRVEVFALIPVGNAVRGAVWKAQDLSPQGVLISVSQDQKQS
jgi:hypothetical protein